MIRILLGVLASTAAWGCSCGTAGSACSWLLPTEIVFLGTVTEDSGEGWGKSPGKMTVDEIFHGLPKETRELTVDTHAGSSCYMRLRKGEQYLIYGSPVAGAKGTVHRNACSFSFMVRGNELLLAALRSAERRTETHLTGKVTVKTEQFNLSNEGAAGVRVVAVSGETRLETITNGDGGFTFRGVPAGKYHLELHTSDYVEDKWRWPREDPSVGATGCGYQSLYVWPNGQLAGTVRGPDGATRPGVNVQVFAKDRRGEMDSSPLREAKTDARGAYVLSGLPAGEFVVGINGEPYHDRDVWAPLYYPDGRIPAEAKWIAIGQGEKRDGIDLRLGPPRKPANLRVELVLADGSPAIGAGARLEDLNGQQRAFSRGKEPTETTHVLNFPVYVGESYQVAGFSYRGAAPYNGKSAAITITGPEAHIRIVLSEGTP
jgi:hypothetical protein